MKKLSLLLCFLFFSLLLLAQPSRTWVSYYGGNKTNVSAVHYDSVGKCIYTAGATGDTIGIATSGGFKSSYSPSYYIPSAYDYMDTDAFLCKWDFEGNLIWATYYGGSGKEHSAQIKTDKAGNIYILGYTESDTGIVSSSAYLSDFLVSSYYLAKFNPLGERIWSTYLGLSDSVYLNGNNYIGYHFIGNSLSYQLDIDSTGNVYAGFITANQKEIGTPGTHKQFKNEIGITPYPGGWIYHFFDIALVKYDSSGTKLWGTYYGGGKDELLSNIYCSQDGFIYLTGWTASDTGIATTGAYRSSLTYSRSNFLAKFDQNGHRIWATYFGAPTELFVKGLTGDKKGNIYLSVHTKSMDSVSTSGVYQEELKGDYDIFIMKFNSLGFRVWGTYLGGEGSDIVDLSAGFWGYTATANSLIYNNGALYLSGSTNDTTGWDTECGYATEFANNGFFAKMDTSGQLIWASHYESPIYDIALSPQFDGKNELYFVGETELNDIATSGAYQQTKITNKAGVVGKMIEEYPCGSVVLDLDYHSGMIKTNSGYSQYYWVHNGDTIANGVDTQLSITDTSGYYYVFVEKCNCIYRSDTFDFSPTSIHDLPSSQKLNIYPNPSKDKLVIDIGIKLSDPVAIYISDLTGRTVMESKRYHPTGTKITLSFANLASGLYFVKIQSKQGNFIGKFVKE